MHSHSQVRALVAICLAGWMGALAASAATTNSVWDVTTISTFKAGKINVVETNPVTAVFLSDGSCSVQLGSFPVTGEYTNTTKQLMLTPDEGGLAALKSNAVALITAQVPPGITISVKSVKFPTKMKLSTAGVPVAAKSTVSGKGSETISGKTKSKSFKLTTLWTNWTLTAGTHF